MEPHGQEEEIDQRAELGLHAGRPDRRAVEPADEELKGAVVGLGQAEGFGGGGAVFLGVEDGGEEGRVVAEELFVDGPVGRVRANVDVDEGVGEEPGSGVFLVDDFKNATVAVFFSLSRVKCVLTRSRASWALLQRRRTLLAVGSGKLEWGCGEGKCSIGLDGD